MLVHEHEFDVIIAGCGPVGVVAANLLGHMGVSTLVVEPSREPYDLPRAIHIDHEIMRIFQSVGLTDTLLPLFCRPAGAMHFGADHAVIRQFHPILESERLGWASDYFFYQPSLETALRKALSGRPSVTIAWGCSLAGLTQDPDGVSVDLHAEGGPRRVRARYLLGCDGGRSTVRQALGIALDDLDFDEPWMVVDALVDGPVTMPDLKGQPEGVDMQQVMFIIGDPTRPTSVMPGVGRHRRWEFMLLPGETAEDFQAVGKVEALLAPWVSDHRCQVIRKAVYRFHALVAKRWHVDRVFLVGDAAHQTPPFFGQGLCHGIRDAANLIWKLKMVLDGDASPAMLASYEIEREPQVRSVIEASVRVGRYICTCDPEVARRRDEDMRQALNKTPPVYFDIIPPLTAGLIGDPAGAPAAVGSRFIQPPMVSPSGARALLDDLTGGGFVLLALDDSVVAAALEDGPPNITAFQVCAPSRSGPSDHILIDCTGELVKWLQHHNQRGLLLRPDHYVYGVFTTAAEARALLNRLSRQLSGKA